MYLPRAFVETREDELFALMREHPFATLVAGKADGLCANHLPMLMIDGRLCGHVAGGNELRGHDGAPVLAIFQGAQGYISPGWYPSKQVTHREVPTWNYTVVHVHGRLRVIDDKAWLRHLLDALTDRHEAGLPVPWRVADAPADHVENMLGAIVGIAIDIDRIEGKFKLSQNHPEANRAGVINGLRQRNAPGDAALADVMINIEETARES